MKIDVAEREDDELNDDDVVITLSFKEAAALKQYLTGEHNMKTFEKAMNGCQLAIRLSKELP